MPEGKTLTDYGRIAYEAYCKTAWQADAEAGSLMRWDQLSPRVQLGWIQAAVSARRGYV